MVELRLKSKQPASRLPLNTQFPILNQTPSTHVLKSQLGSSTRLKEPKSDLFCTIFIYLYTILHLYIYNLKIFHPQRNLLKSLNLKAV